MNELQRLSLRHYLSPPAQGHWPPVFVCERPALVWHLAALTYPSGPVPTVCRREVAGLLVAAQPLPPKRLSQGPLLEDARRVALQEDFLDESEARYCPDCFPYLDLRRRAVFRFVHVTIDKHLGCPLGSPLPSR